MRRTLILVLRLALRVQIAIWRLLRMIKRRFSTRFSKLAIYLSIKFDALPCFAMGMDR
ncbi:MAG TPA: hypothetical protein VHT91_06795 [Kofleriaceae bacterium]|jgi:hypothetical protein|nr:hypothetical protein [Kofleriaceae bacterium]